MPGQQARRKAEIKITGPRLALRALSDTDRPAIEPWYAEAAAVTLGLAREDAPNVQNLYYELEAARPDPGAGLLVIARRDPSTRSTGSGQAGSGQAPTPIGLIDYRAGLPAPGWLTIGFIAVAAAYRGHGYGSEAVRLLEADARRRGIAGRFRADVAMNNGLGVYFWLRLGYRPARPGELGEAKPPLPRGTLTMVRTADEERVR